MKQHKTARRTTALEVLAVAGLVVALAATAVAGVGFALGDLFGGLARLGSAGGLQ